MLILLKLKDFHPEFFITLVTVIKWKRLYILAVRSSEISMVNRFPDIDGHNQLFCSTVFHGYAPPLAWVIPAGYWLRPM
jgi:hypothetical protein